MQLLSVELLSNPITIVISMKKLSTMIAPIQLPTTTLFISIFISDDIYLSTLSLLHPYSIHLLVLQNLLHRRYLQRSCRMPDHYSWDNIFQHLDLSAGFLLVGSDDILRCNNILLVFVPMHVDPSWHMLQLLHMYSVHQRQFEYSSFDFVGPFPHIKNIII